MDGADVVAVYEAGDEDARLALPRNEVEWSRTCELLRDSLPDPPARLLDVGGASGRYAACLRELGYQVNVIDLVPGHVAAAQARGLPAAVADARNLPHADASADAVLLLGPLYHLITAADRARALAEAMRVCVPAGVVIVAAMSRWAKPSVRAARDQLGDPEIQRHLLQVLRHGHDPDGDAFERIAYHHDPDELRDELRAAGLDDVVVVGVEGPLGAAARELPQLNELAVRAARLCEARAPHLSIHLLGWGRRFSSANATA